jgi:hypothetical protein
MKHPVQFNKTFLCIITLMEAAPLCPFSSSKIEDLFTVRKNFMRLSIDWPEGGIFIAGETLRISGTAKYEPAQSEV